MVQKPATSLAPGPRGGGAGDEREGNGKRPGPAEADRQLSHGPVIVVFTGYPFGFLRPVIPVPVAVPTSRMVGCKKFLRRDRYRDVARTSRYVTRQDFPRTARLAAPSTSTPVCNYIAHLRPQSDALGRTRSPKTVHICMCAL
jgi:hypothetical protein